MPDEPVVLILGPSGAGKSTLAGWLAEDLGLLALEIDAYSGGTGIDARGLRAEWNACYEDHRPQALAAELRRRATDGGFAGAVMSLPGNVVLAPALIESGEAIGLFVVICYGSGAECVDAFIPHAEQLGIASPVDHWIGNNQASYAKLSAPGFAPSRLLMFENGTRRSRSDVVGEVRRRLAS